MLPQGSSPDDPLSVNTWMPVPAGPGDAVSSSSVLIPPPRRVLWGPGYHPAASLQGAAPRPQGVSGGASRSP